MTVILQMRNQAQGQGPVRGGARWPGGRGEMHMCLTPGPSLFSTSHPASFPRESPGRLQPEGPARWSPPRPRRVLIKCSVVKDRLAEDEQYITLLGAHALQSKALSRGAECPPLQAGLNYEPQGDSVTYGRGSGTSGTVPGLPPGPCLLPSSPPTMVAPNLGSEKSGEEEARFE